MIQDDITELVAEICDRNRDALLAIVDLLAARDPIVPDNQNGPAEETRHVIEQIKAKEFVSPNEAALLFGCSPQHLRNLVQRAIENKATEPIPFRDLDGVVTFPLTELMEWSCKPKPKTKKVAKKNKTHLKAVVS
jgi:hypothetical protein